MMRKVSATGETFPLARPFAISRGVKTAAEVITVTIERNGVTGRGEGVPYPRYGESVSSALAQVSVFHDRLADGADRMDLLEAMPAGAARNAVDCALWDLEMRLAGRTIDDALGIADARPVPTALTVGLDTPGAMGEAAAEIAEVPLIKVKVDANDVEARLRAVRAAAPKPRMIVDPNESWTMDLVDGLQDLLAELRIDLLEQPLPAGQDDGLRGYRSRIPIAADEALHTAEDLDHLPDGYSVANIKLDKSGGLTAALRLADAAEARGMQLMVGCMISSSLSIVPAMALAQARKIAFADLDGPLWLAQDRKGGVTCDKGLLARPQPRFWGG